MKTTRTKLSLWILTALGFSIGLLAGVLLIHYNILPEQADAQVYVACAMLFGGLAFFIGDSYYRT